MSVPSRERLRQAIRAEWEPSGPIAERAGVGRIPLRNHSGEIIAWAVISEFDLEMVSRHRWCLHGRGYAITQIDGRKVLLHRFLLGLQHGDQRQGDHINGDRLDNRRENLRIVTRGQNSQNVRRGGSSRYRGVHWSTRDGGWVAQAKRSNGSSEFLGRFSSEEEAGRVAADRRAEIYTHVNEDRHPVGMPA